MRAAASGDSGAQRISVLKVIGAVTIVVLVVWFILANVTSVAVSLWWAQVNVPMWIVVLAAFLAGWGFGQLVRLWRGKRARVVTD